MDIQELEAIVCATLAAGIIAVERENRPSMSAAERAVEVYHNVRKAMQSDGGPFKPVREP